MSTGLGTSVTGGGERRFSDKVSYMSGPHRSGYRDRNSTADRALDILLLFTDETNSLTGAEIAQALGVARSTGYRYLQSLLKRSLVEEDAGRYRLGPRVFELARVARAGFGLVEVARPAMVELAEETHHTVLLTRRSGTHAVCVDAVESSRPVRISYRVGHVTPLNAGAAAQVLLAWEDSRVVDEVLRGAEWARFTDRTITDSATMAERLKRIRARGMAIAQGELDPDIVGVAAPIFDSNSTVRAAVSIAAVSSRYQSKRAREYEVAVRRTADRISERLALMQL